jgi:hypothetical protein
VTGNAGEVTTLAEAGDPQRMAPRACPDCFGVRGQDCLECRYIQRACPLSGDVGWDYATGIDDPDGVACRIGCGYWWRANDPRLVRAKCCQHMSDDVMISGGVGSLRTWSVA